MAATTVVASGVEAAAAAAAAVAEGPEAAEEVAAGRPDQATIAGRAAVEVARTAAAGNDGVMTQQDWLLTTEISVSVARSR